MRAALAPLDAITLRISDRFNRCKAELHAEQAVSTPALADLDTFIWEDLYLMNGEQDFARTFSGRFPVLKRQSGVGKFVGFRKVRGTAGHSPREPRKFLSEFVLTLFSVFQEIGRFAVTLKADR